MHRKSIEAAEHLKDDNTNSDHEETTSMRTDVSDTSATSSQPPQTQPNHVTSGEKDQQPLPSINGQQAYSEDPEAFRNNSIACLRAKAQEHSAKLLNHNLMLHVRPNPQSCDANANNLHHQEAVNSESNQAIF
ncbi:hypothetical protein NQ314_020435 [Rhamnusium bicolor]|uniref:OAR domain-containing protein n=1 Tax=Rhamnusium bicolor TaxID=1586634 RepID=A0AAV8WM23_9CUCU|nr:hypothetical protein NQ314_020435 [Rhamnusium bicolor]